ncbi:MAG: TetR family transcriptional regulator [Magnetococcales bacterium]|nr:TetR family transcriptional regulator [Magnetococcales bacterium]
MLTETDTNPAATPSEENQKIDRRRRPERRVEILQAVMTLLEKGNRRVTTADLATEVGVSEAALYRHFSGKNAIFHSLTEYLQDHLLKPVRQLGESGPYLLQLRRLFEYHLRFFSDHPGLCRIFLVEGVMTRTESQFMASVIATYGKEVQKILADAQQAGEIGKDLNLEQTANYFVGMIQAATLRFVIGGFTTPPTTEIPVLWTFFCHGIGVEPKDA